MGPPGTRRLSAAGMPVTAPPARPGMPVRHAPAARATRASVVVRIRLVRNPAPLLRLKQPSNFSAVSSRDHARRWLASFFMTWQPELDDVRRRRDLAERMGGPDKVRRQHEAGRLTVRERLAALLDDGSFREIGAPAGAAAPDGGGELTRCTPPHLFTGP